MEVSQSKIKSWRQCRQAYDYKYIQGLTKKFKPMPFMRGTIIHNMLEAHYLKKDPWKSFKKDIKENDKAIRLNPEEYGDLSGHLKILMEGYFEFYKKDKLKIISVEDEFRTQLVNDIYLVGKRDLVAQEDGLNWMTEHKCHNKIPDGSMIPYANLQSALYVWEYNKNNSKKLDGIMWNYLWGKPPTVPQLLKDGTMSKRSSQLTWPMYKTALKEAKLNPADYVDVKQELTGNESLYYSRKKVPLNKTLINNIVEDAKITALEIQKFAGKDKTRNLGYNCERCEFKNLCMAQLKGLDTNFIIKADFKRRDK